MQRLLSSVCSTVSSASNALTGFGFMLLILQMFHRALGFERIHCAELEGESLLDVAVNGPEHVFPIIARSEFWR